MKYKVTYLDKRNSIPRECKQTMELEELTEFLAYMEKRSDSFSLVSVFPVA